MAKTTFKYKRRERTTEDIRAKASEGARDFDNLWKGDVKLFKPRDGENIVRILPPTWGSQPYTNSELDKMSEKDLRQMETEDERWGNGWDIVVWIHYGIGPDNGKYLCREKMLGERCACCDAQKTSRDPDEADALKPAKRGLAWVIDREAEKDGPQLWAMPWTKVRGEIYSRSVDKKHGTPIIVDGGPPDFEGYDIMFTKTGKEDRTNYTGVEIARDASPISEDEKREDRWLKYLMDNPLPSVLNFFEAEHIEKVLRGRASSRRSDEAETVDERPGRGEGQRKSTRFSRRGDDEKERDYLSEEGTEDPEEAETQPPSRRSTRRGAEIAVEEEQEVRRRRGRPLPDVSEPSDEDSDGDIEDEEIEEEIEEESQSRRSGGRSNVGSSRRSLSTSTARKSGEKDDPDDEEEEEDDDDESQPSEQARSKLRSLRDRRGR